MKFGEFEITDPILAVAVVILLYALTIAMSTLVFRSWNRFLRHLNIRTKGWPPPHLDADGDFRPLPIPKEDDDDEHKHDSLASTR